MAALHEARDLMSKAFVQESDSEADLPYEPPAIPAGIKNYMTPQGYRQMQDELHQPLRVERPKVVEAVTWAATAASMHACVMKGSSRGSLERSGTITSRAAAA